MSNITNTFNDAIAALNSGELKRAEELFNRVIKNDNANVPALNLLVVVLIQMGRFGEAEPFIAKAISLNQSSDISFYNYGLISKHLNKPRQALENFSKALGLNPNVAETWNNRGTVFNDLKEFDQAISDFDKAIALNSVYAEAYTNKGKSLTLLKRYDEALAAYDKALSIKPDLTEAWLGRGSIFTDFERYDEAFAAYDKALSIKPDLTEAWLGRGNVFYSLQHRDEAIAAYDKALALKPDLETAWLGRGNAFADLKRFDEAFAAYDKALSIKTDLAEAWLGRGNVLTDLKRYDEAFAAYDKALSIKPDLAAVYASMGDVFSTLGRDADALKAHDKAVELDPRKASAHFKRSITLLTLGRYGEGWEEFEWRKKLPILIDVRTFSQPPLSRIENVKGTTVFIYGEQGLGDRIHFCRYVTLLAEQGAKVILESHKALFQVFKTLNGVSQLIEAGQPVPAFDYHCAIMSLPHLFKTTLESIPSRVPYLSAETDKVEKWSNRLGKKAKPRIGLVWSGGFRPDQPDLWAVSQRKKIPLTKFSQFKGINAEFYSVQKGEAAVSELKTLQSDPWDGPAIIDFTDEINDFSDTAALIENLDLIISVDTSTAHLAGAMAKPVWVLNRFDNDWRWLPNYPWYPTAKIFKQKEPDNWDDVIAAVRTDLLQQIKNE